MNTPRTELEAMPEEKLNLALFDAARNLRAQGTPSLALAVEEAARRLRERAWIPVSERLPEEGVCVLVTGYYYGDEKSPRWTVKGVLARGVLVDLDEDRLDYATHWQPLPPPQRAEEPKHG